MNDRDQAYVAIHRVASHVSPEDLHELANLETDCIRAGYHYGTGAQLAAHDAMSKKVGQIIDAMDDFSISEMATHIRNGYNKY